MYPFKLILVILIGVLLPASVFGVTFQRLLGGNQPDLLLIVVVLVALSKGPFWGAVTGFFSGLGMEVFSSSQVGLQALILLMVGYVIGFIGQQIYCDSIFSQSIGVFFATLGVKWFQIGVLAMGTGDAVLGFCLSKLAQNWLFLPVAFFNSALTLFIARFVQKPRAFEGYQTLVQHSQASAWERGLQLGNEANGEFEQKVREIRPQKKPQQATDEGVGEWVSEWVEGRIEGK